MLKKKTVLRFILGLKIRQLRARRNLSLKELAEVCDMSVSYLNEIENGKKYPKIEKLAALSQGLGVDLGDLVSFKTGRNLHPLLKFLESDMVGKIPLELFGLSESDVVDLMGHDPEKFASFVLTVLQISRSFDMKLEDVYQAALRSFIEANDNYFAEIEKLAKKARSEFNLNSESIGYDEISAILINKYGYEFDETTLGQLPLADESKFVAKRSVPPKVYLNPRLKKAHKTFYVAKEVGHLYMGKISRPNEVSQISLGALLDDFKTSYFAGALLLDEKIFSKEMKIFFSNPQFDSKLFLTLLSKYKVSSEVLFHRLTQVLSTHFKVNELFFLSVSTQVENSEKLNALYSIEKELHLSQLHSPHGVRMNENYCQRWVAIKSIQQLKNSKLESEFVLGQISVVEDGQEYFSISLAQHSSIKPNLLESLTIGFLMNDELKNVIKFLDDKSLKRVAIGQTCERCPKLDCDDRIANATILKQQLQKNQIEKALISLSR